MLRFEPSAARAAAGKLNEFTAAVPTLFLEE
jgi:hypothetical protein